MNLPKFHKRPGPYAPLPILASLVFMMFPGLSGCAQIAESDLTDTLNRQADGNSPGPSIAPDVDASASVPSETEASSHDFFLSSAIGENPNSVLSCFLALKTRDPARVAVAFESYDTPVQYTGRSEQGTDHVIAVVGMRSTKTYTLTPVAYLDDGTEIKGKEFKFTTGPVPEGTPQLEVTVHEPDMVQPGITLLGPANPQNDTAGAPDYVGVDSEGAVVWYYKVPEQSISGGQAGGGHLDRHARQLPDGNILLALKDEYRIITPAGDKIRSIAGNKGAMGCNTGLGTIHHDIDLLPNGNALLLSSELCTIDGTPMGDNKAVKGDTIFELTPEGIPVWEWHAFNVLDPTRFPGELSQRLQQGPKGQSYDWTHANSITYVAEDDTILMSLRHQNWVIKIDHQSKQLVWILGDTTGENIGKSFELAEGGDWFYSQHAPQLQDDGTILIYDNGNERPGAPNSYSRAVLYSINEENLKAEQLWEYQTDEFTGFLGDANKLENGNFLVVAGGIRIQQGNGGSNPVPGVGSIVEVAPGEGEFGDGNMKVWELKTNAFIFRAERILSFWPETP